MYISHFEFPDIEDEYDFLMGIQRKCYNTFYPFKVLSKNGLRMLDFEPITILYGGNGSGKTTALNVIAQKLGLNRDALYNRSNFFDDYLKMCDYELCDEVPKDSRIITSDDVFDYMLTIRSVNDGIHERREEMYDDYLDAKFAKFRMNSMEDYECLKQITEARRMTQSRYVREHLMANIDEHSNGESAFIYFSEKIKENALYLLDEPENSLSPERQQELLVFLTDSARFFGCQFIIATHSPFLLSARGAKIYDLDEKPVDIKKWTELPNVRSYYDFFKKYEKEFK